MGDVGYRGVSADQDGRFRNKEQALLKKLASDGQFAEQFSQKVNMSKVNVEVMKPWISDKVQELLGFEDDVVVEYIHGMLEDPDNKVPDPKKMQLSLTGFLEGQTAKFMADLWSLLLSAQKSLGGIPQEFVERKKEEMRLARERDQKAIHSSGAVGGAASIHDHRRAGPKGTDATFNTSTGRRDFYEGGARRGGDPSAARGRSGGRGAGRFGGGEEGGGPSRRDFVDRSGNRTERVQDRGWGARAAGGAGPGGAERSPPRRSDLYSRQAYSRRAYEDDRQERKGSFHREPIHIQDRGRRDADEDRSATPEMKDRRRSNLAPALRERDRSITPVLRADRRSRQVSRSASRSLSRSYSPPRYRRRMSPRRSLSRSRSRSPPPRRRHRRSSSYTPPADDLVRSKRRRSRSVSPPPPRRRLIRDSSVSRSPPSRASSRSRSPPPRRRRDASRSRSRTYSPRRPTR